MNNDEKELIRRVAQLSKTLENRVVELEEQLKDKEEECQELIELIHHKDELIKDLKRLLKSAAKQVPGIEY